MSALLQSHDLLQSLLRRSVSDEGWSATLSSSASAPPVLTLTLSRARAMNALDPSAMQTLEALLTTLPFEALGAVVLYGAGGRFIAGGDLKALGSLKSEEQARALSSGMQRALKALSSAPIPSLCAVEGFAIGGGAEVSVACDLCVMAEGAYLRFAQRSLGLSTAWGGARNLARALGSRQAFALLCRDDKITSAEAQQLGLAHRLTPPGEALTVAQAWAQALAETPEATQALKALCVAGEDLTDEALELERQRFVPLWTSETHWERVERLWSQRHRSQRQSRHALSRGGAMEERLTEPQRGRFIVFEGIDGAGTTTQAQRLVERLRAVGERAHFTNEPSEGVIGALTRRALRGEPLGRAGRPLPAQAIALMFAADRADHWHNEIEPRLARGEHVVCDRYLYSSVAYQSLENPEEWIRALNSPFPHPDLLIYLQASPQLAAERRALRGLEADRYEQDQLQVKIASAYDRVCAEFGALTLDASLSIEALGLACAEALERLFAQRTC